MLHAFQYATIKMIIFYAYKNGTTVVAPVMILEVVN